jgi:hypothetical protein
MTHPPPIQNPVKRNPGRKSDHEPDVSVLHRTSREQAPEFAPPLIIREEFDEATRIPDRGILGEERDPGL